MSTIIIDERFHSMDGCWELLLEIWTNSGGAYNACKTAISNLKRAYLNKAQNIPLFPADTGRITWVKHDTTPTNRDWLLTQSVAWLKSRNCHTELNLKKLLSELSDEEIKNWRDKEGDKLGSYFKQMICDEFSDYIVSMLNMKKKPHYFVMSINPLDIALMSEYCTYESCYNFNGCYKYAPQSHIKDRHTILCYVYSSSQQEYGKISLPKKKMRRVAYYTTNEIIALVFSRIYGTNAYAPFFEKFGLELMNKSHNLNFEISSIPSWTIEIDSNSTVYIDMKRYSTSYQLEYTGIVPAGYNAIHKAEKPIICMNLTEKVICLNCGEYVDRTNADSENWNCDNCSKTEKCQHCGEYYENTNYIDNLDISLCDCCLDNYYCSCDGCEDVFHVDSLQNVDFNSYCYDCLDQYCTKCLYCEEFFAKDNIYKVDDDYVCEICLEKEYSYCSGCNNYINNSDWDSCYNLCSDCADEERRKEEREEEKAHSF